MIEAKITQINSYEGIDFICFKNLEQEFFMLSLGLSKTLKINQSVILGFKSTECTLSKDKIKSNLSNEIKAVITQIDVGKILSVIKLKNNFCVFDAQISTLSLEVLKFKLNEEIYVYINPSALFIKEILC